MAVEEEAPATTLRVTFVPPVADPKTVRFRGTTFQDLKRRLVEAKVPGVGSTSYVEVEVPNQGFVCLLDEDKIPNDAELHVRVALDLVPEGGTPAVVHGKPPFVPEGAHAQRGLPEVAMSPRWAKHMHKMHKLDRKVKERNARLQEKVHKMYDRLERHGRWHSPPPPPHAHPARVAYALPRPPIEDSLCSVRAAIGFPGPPPASPSPASPLRPHYRGRHHSRRHGRSSSGAHVSIPLGIPPPVGIPIDLEGNISDDPSGAGAHAIPVDPAEYKPLAGAKGEDLASDLKGMKLHE